MNVETNCRVDANEPATTTFVGGTLNHLLSLCIESITDELRCLLLARLYVTSKHATKVIAFLTLPLALTVLCAPLAADAQPAGKISRVGVIGARAPPDTFLSAFRQGMREKGYIEG